MNMKFVTITNEKAMFTFHAPVQMPAFPCSEESSGCNELEMQAAWEVCWGELFTARVALL